MSEGKRPGGLTALAVINFVFTGFSLISILGLAAITALIGMVPTDKMEPAQKAQIEALQSIGTGVYLIILVLTLISAVLLLLSGIGYLKQKKVMGWCLGNTYAVISIVGSTVMSFYFPTELGGGFSIGRIIDLIYPILTLVLLNTTFKDDLTN